MQEIGRGAKVFDAGPVRGRFLPMEGPDDDAEYTHTGSQLPIDLAEHVNVLDESIDSLRAEMRAASDETAVMEQTESVIVVANAVSSAAEHIERARAAVRTLKSVIGMN